MRFRKLAGATLFVVAATALLISVHNWWNKPEQTKLPTVSEQAAAMAKVKYQLEFQGFALAGTPWRDYHVGNGSGTDKVFVRVNDCALAVVATVVYNDRGTMTPLKLQFTRPTKTADGIIPTVSYEVQPPVEQSKALCPAASDVSAMQGIMQKLAAAGFAINGGVYTGSNQDFGTTLQLPGCPLISQGQASDYRGTHVIITNANSRSNVTLTSVPTAQQVVERQLCPIPGQ